MKPTRISLDIHPHDEEIDVNVSSPSGPGTFNINLGTFPVDLTIYFNSAEALQLFDESLHAAIEEALFSHLLAATPDKTVGEALNPLAEQGHIPLASGKNSVDALSSLKPLTWTELYFHCKGCGTTNRASEEFIASAREDSGDEGDPADIVNTFDVCLDCGGYGEEYILLGEKVDEVVCLDGHTEFDSDCASCQDILSREGA